MIPYIIHVAILLAGCYVFYQLLLRNETFFQLNRWLLVGCVTLSFLAPLYEMPENWSLRTSEQVTAFTPQNEAIKLITPSKIELIDPKIPAFEKGQEKETTIAKIKETVTITPAFSVKNISWQLILWSIYVIGLSIFAINFLLQLGILLYNIFKYPNIQDGRFKIVELTKDKPPYSFLNYIFINPTQYDWDTYNQILEHEKIHIEERHTFDILLSELVVVLQWFNPFAWWYRKVVENNLEYLTDQKMLQKGTNRKNYQMNLLKISVPEFPLNMTMNYNQSFLKKRIIMMDTKKSSASSTWKYLFLLPLFGISLISLNTVKPIPAIPALLPTHITDDGHELPTFGQWKGDIMDKMVCLTFDNSDSRKARISHFDECFAKASFSELPTTKKTFEVKRAAGTLQLTGKFTGKEGKGSFKFIENKDFKANLIARFEEKEVSTSDLFHCFFADINADYMAYLEAGDFEDLDYNDIIDLARHNIPLSEFKKLNEGLKSLGYNGVGIENVTELLIHKVSPEYIKTLGKEIYKDLSVENIIDAKIHNVQPEYIKKFKAAGYSTDFETIVKFATHDVDLEYIKSLKAAGLSNLTEKQIIEAAIHKVSPKYLKQFEASKYKDMDFDKIIEFAIHNVDLDYIESLETAGLNDLTHEQIVQAAIHKVSPKYLKQFDALEYKDMTFDQIIEFAIHNVDLDYIESLKAAGFNDLTYNQLVQASIHKVSPKYLKELQTLEYKDMTFDQIIQFAIHNVDLDYIESLKAAGFNDLTYDQLVQASIHKVSPKYLKLFEAMEYKDMTFDQIIQFAIHNVDLDYIESLKAAGFNELTFDQLVQASIHKVSPKYLKQFEASKYKDMKFDEIIEFAIHKIDLDYIESLKAAGLNDLTHKQIVEAAIHKVNPKYLKQFKNSVFKDMPFDEIIGFAIHDVDIEYIQSLQNAGFKDLTYDEIREAAIHKVDVDFIKNAEKLGFKNMSMKKIIELSIHQVTAKYVNSLRDLGYKNLNVGEVTKAKMHGIDAEFIRDLNALGFKEIPIYLLIELQMHHVDADYIKEMQAKGKTGLSLEEYKRMKVRSWENEE